MAVNRSSWCLTCKHRLASIATLYSGDLTSSRLKWRTVLTFLRCRLLLLRLNDIVHDCVHACCRQGLYDLEMYCPISWRVIWEPALDASLYRHGMLSVRVLPSAARAFIDGKHRQCFFARAHSAGCVRRCDRVMPQVRLQRCCALLRGPLDDVCSTFLSPRLRYQLCTMTLKIVLFVCCVES